MKNKYQQAQECIHVTPEMKERLLHSVNEESKKPSSKAPFCLKRNVQRFSAIAASLAVLICGTYFIPWLAFNNKQPPLTLDKIQEDVYFDLYAPSVLPTGYELSDYSVSGDMVSISYKNGEAEIDFSMAKSTYGLMNNTDSVDTTVIHNDPGFFGPATYAIVSDVVVVLYGDDNKYRYAEWYDEGYDFGISFSKPLSEDDVVSIIKSVTHYE